MMQMGLLSVCKKICINLHKFIFYGHSTSTEIPVFPLSVAGEGEGALEASWRSSHPDSSW